MSLLQAGFGSSGDDYTIDDSLRFRSSASAYLNRTPASATNQKTWTWSGWVKRSNIAANGQLFTARTAVSATYFGISFQSSGDLRIECNLETAYPLYKTNALFRDPSAWYHIVVALDMTQATSTNRLKVYINGVLQTTASYNVPAQNTDLNVNSTATHLIGQQASGNYLDGYLTEVNFIDGQALTPSDFGEYDANGTWKPLEYTGTYGTNGFYLPMTPTTQATGFNTVIFEGNDAVLSVDGVGFSPDFVWLKDRDTTGYGHQLFDTVRGVTKYLSSNGTGAEGTSTGVTSFDADGFTLGSSGFVNRNSIVAWCWDAGSGSPVSNTAGTITSTVKANPATGFSIVSYTGNGVVGATVGHGLGVAPNFFFVKRRDTTGGWYTYHSANTAAPETDYLFLNTNAATADALSVWDDVAPTSDVLSLGVSVGVNGNGGTYVAYCFAEVAGYSKFDSYSGTGSSGNAITTGFRPGFVMIKRTDTTGNWILLDSIRDPLNSVDSSLVADLANAETANNAAIAIDFNSDGFTIQGTGNGVNNSSGTYIYMAFADTADARFNFDASGNKNNWLPNNINSNGESETTYDLMKDTPSLVDTNAGNFATLNPLNDPRTYVSYSDGNLTAINTSAALHSPFIGTIGMAANSGKYYFEVNTAGDANTRNASGIGTAASMSTTTVWAYAAGQVGFYIGGAAKIYFANQGTTGVFNKPWVTGDVLQYAYDANTGKFWAGQNNVWYNATGGTTGDPATGANPTVTLANADTWFAGGTVFNQGVGSYSYYNFGQRPFAYTPPSGFLKLNTFNLPDSTIEKGDDYFNTVLYTGTGAIQSITGINFQPDLVWAKSRSEAVNHRLFDSVRGATNRLSSNSTGVEGAESGVTSFDSDGFTLGSDGGINTSSATYVAWNWLASNTTASNTVGSITSTVSVNTTSGFSIVSYTGTGSAATVGHGLGVAPSMVVVKNRTTAIGGAWPVYHISMGATYYMFLEITDAKSTTATPFNDTAPTASVFSVDGSNRVNQNTNAMIAYCFAEVEGYSAFGSYTGNGSTDGPFIYTGFRPAWIMIKSASSAGDSWLIFDSKRTTANVMGDYFRAESANAEATFTALDLLSNGFKLRTTSGAVNDATTFIYMAFAENPFKNALAR